MHLCALLIGGPVISSHAVWRNPAQGSTFLDFDYYKQIAQVLERGKFDLMFFADRLAIADRFGGMDIGIRHADQDATRFDPMPILSAISAVTENLGLGATRSTTYGQPYSVAREFCTLDHMSGGRAAWNVVTSMNDGEALNFGVESHMSHDERYDRADEFLDVTMKLWHSWDKDALVMDRAAGIYADPSKVRYLDHKGTYFSCRGPLNMPQSPQGNPVIIQAGSSGRGKQFAARWAEVIFNVSPSFEVMRAFREDVQAEMAKVGRAPDACKVLGAVMTFVGETEKEAEEKRDLHNESVHPLVGLSTLCAHANLDLSGLDLDQPIDEIRSTGSQGNIGLISKIAKDGRLTLRDVGKIYGRSIMIPQVTGTPDQVADRLEEIYKAGTCDGFVLSPGFVPETFVDFVDHIVPRLQDKGLFRRDYAGKTLRENLEQRVAEPVA